MGFVCVLACAAALAVLFRKGIKARSGALYALAACVDLLFLATPYFEMPSVVEDLLFLLVHKCTLALALFVVVMFIGAFPRGSFVDRTLRPIRAELSVAACLLALGHMAFYLMSYLPRLLSGGVVTGAVGASFAMAVVLLALVVVLGATSFKAVKSRMSTDAWRRLQRWAYLFYGLIWAHLMLMLAPAALAGSSAALIDCAIYTVVFGAYAVMRIYRWRRDAALAVAEAAGSEAAQLS